MSAHFKVLPEGQEASAAPPESAALEYERLLRASSLAQLRNDAEAVRRLERLLAETAQRLREAIRTTPRGIIGERYRRALLANLEAALESFRAEYKAILDDGVLKAVAIVEERERGLVEALYRDRASLSMQEGHAVITSEMLGRVSFGTVPRVVLERTWTRVWPDGLRLTDRVYQLDLEARRRLGELVTQALATGQSARELARQIAPEITKPGVDNVRYRAMRIARTEINNAYRDGYVQSVAPDGKLPAYIEAIGWRLSAAHPRICICDALAGDDMDGLGPGNYLPGNVPSVSHPHCMCYLVSVLAAFPDRQWVSTEARPGEVPERERRYYGREIELQEV